MFETALLEQHNTQCTTVPLRPTFGTPLTKLNIALDFDDTFTADPSLWMGFIVQCKKKEHDIRFVTYRFQTPNGYSNDEIESIAKAYDIPIIYCNGRQKEHVTEEQGFSVNIWIDDSPYFIPSFEKLEGMVKGCKVNKDTNKEYKRKEMLDKWSSNPLVIG